MYKRGLTLRYIPYFNRVVQYQPNLRVPNLPIYSLKAASSGELRAEQGGADCTPSFRLLLGE